MENRGLRGSSIRSLPNWLLVSAFWTLLTLLVSGQALVSLLLSTTPRSLRGALLNPVPPPWLNPVVWSTIWLVWIGTTPLVVVLARRWPIERDRLLRRVLAHTGLALTAALVQSFIQSVLIHLIWIGMGRPLPYSFWISKTAGQAHVNFLVYWLILGTALALDYYSRFRASQIEATELRIRAAELAGEVAKAQLQALKAQISPHFLFNAHHAVVGLILKNENEKAVEMLVKLGQLLRASISSRSDEISLAEELEYVRLYLSIQELRFPDRLRFALDVQPGITSAAVPCLLTQPLVENCVKHGVEKSAVSNLIQLRAFRQNGHLIVEVEDDGPGISDFDQPQDSPGTGIRNVRTRLEKLYGTDQAFRFSTAPGGGLLVHIELPLKYVGPEIREKAGYGNQGFDR